MKSIEEIQELLRLKIEELESFNNTKEDPNFDYKEGYREGALNVCKSILEGTLIENEQAPEKAIKGDESWYH